jgi:prevent-host-death family protein
MKTVSATEFKTHCLALLREVVEHHETLVVTKHGRPVAQVTPYVPASEESPLRGSVVSETDLVSPLNEAWDVEE